MRHLFAICLCSASLLTWGAEESQAQFYGSGYARRSCCYGGYYSPVTSYYTPITSYYVPVAAYYGATSACCPTNGCNTCGTSSCCSTTVGYAPAQSCCGTSSCCASTGCCPTGCCSGCSTGCCGAGGCSTGNYVTGGNLDRIPRTAAAQPRLRSRIVAAPVPQQRVVNSIDTRFVNADVPAETTPIVQRASSRRVAEKPAAPNSGWEPIR